jgi:hypothetical protein
MDDWEDGEALEVQKPADDAGVVVRKEKVAAYTNRRNS